MDSTIEILISALIYAAIAAAVVYAILVHLGSYVSVREGIAIPYILAAGMGGVRFSSGILSFYDSVPAQPDATPEHSALRLWLSWWAVGLGIFSTMVGGIMVLTFGRGEGFVLVFSADLPVTTILALALLSRYTAKSFAADVAKLEQTTVASLDGIGDNILASSREQIASFRSSTSAMVDETHRAAVEQATILRELTQVLTKVSKYLESELNLTQEVRAQGVFAAEAQARAIKEDRSREEDRSAAETKAAEEERVRLMPELVAELRTTGPIVHRLAIDYQNIGPMGQNLNFVVRANEVVKYRGGAGEIRPQGLLKFDIGDVTEYGTSASVTVTGKVSDAVARQYQFSLSFDYSREVGLFGLTKSVTINPSGATTVTLSPLSTVKG